MEVKFKREPHEQQIKFLDSAAREQLYGGAKRGGKSVAIGMKAILLSVIFPGNRILLARKDYTDLLDTTLAEFWNTVPSELLDKSYGNGTGHNKGERCIRLKTIREGVTSDILYRGLGGPEDIEKVKSINLGALLIDEPSEINFEVYKMLNAQLTWILPDGTRPAYMTCLGSNPEPGWVKDRFIDNPVAGSEFIPALPRQNPHLPDGWEQELRASYDDEWIEKYLDGSWLVTEGSVFPELDPRIHAIPEGLVDIRGVAILPAIDHASTGVTCEVVMAWDDNENFFALGEHYEKDKLISHHVAQMLKLESEFTISDEEAKAMQCEPKTVRFRLIDPSTNQRTLQGKQHLQSIADEYRQNGMNVVPAWNAMEKSISRIKEALHVQPNHVHPFKKGPNGEPVLGSPHLFIVRRRCPNLWKEMSEWRKKISEHGKVTYYGPDHAIDPVRYIFNHHLKARPHTPRDIDTMPPQDRLLIRSHDRFVQKWGNKGKSNKSWFAKVKH